MKKVVWLVLILAVLYAGFSFAIRLMMPFHLYPGTHTRYPEDDRLIRNHGQREYFSTGEGRVEAWYLPGKPEPTGAAVIWAHGNAELIDHQGHHIAPLVDSGISVLMIEYPGYGRSEGVPTQKRIRTSYVHGYDWLARRSEIDPDSICFVGRSLGTAVVASLSGYRTPCCIVLISPFTSAWQLVDEYRIPSFILRDQWKTLLAMERFQGPLVVVHGTRDLIVPYSQGKEIAETASNARLMSYDAGHLDIYGVADIPAIVIDQIRGRVKDESAYVLSVSEPGDLTQAPSGLTTKDTLGN